MAARRVLAVAALALAAVAVAAAGKPASPAQVRQSTLRAYAAAAVDKHEAMPCRQAIGVATAKAVVRYCRYVSSATHPPCNSANDCSTIVGEIKRSCPAGGRLPCASGFKDEDWRAIGKLTAY